MTVTTTAAGQQVTGAATIHNTKSTAFTTSFFEFDVGLNPSTSTPSTAPTLTGNRNSGSYVSMPLTWVSGDDYWASHDELLPLSAGQTAILHFRMTFKSTARAGTYETRVLVGVQSCNMKVVGHTANASFVYAPAVTPTTSASVTPTPTSSISVDPSAPPSSGVGAFGVDNAPAVAATPSSSLDAVLANGDTKSGHGLLILAFVIVVLLAALILIVIAVRRSRRRDDDDGDDAAGDATFASSIGYSFDEALPRRTDTAARRYGAPGPDGQAYGAAPTYRYGGGDNGATQVGFGGGTSGYPPAFPDPYPADPYTADAYDPYAADPYPADPYAAGQRPSRRSGYGSPDAATAYGQPTANAPASGPAYGGAPTSGPAYGGAPTSGPAYGGAPGFGGDAPGYSGAFVPSQRSTPAQYDGSTYGRGPAYDAGPAYPPAPYPGEPAYLPDQAYPPDAAYPPEPAYPAETTYQPSESYDPRWGAEPAEPPASTGHRYRYDEPQTEGPGRHGAPAAPDAYEPDPSVRGWQGDGYAGYQDESRDYHPNQ
jgi:hypothetical protein